MFRDFQTDPAKNWSSLESNNWFSTSTMKVHFAYVGKYFGVFWKNTTCTRLSVFSSAISASINWMVHAESLLKHVWFQSWTIWCIWNKRSIKYIVVNIAQYSVRIYGKTVRMTERKRLQEIVYKSSRTFSTLGNSNLLRRAGQRTMIKRQKTSSTKAMLNILRHYCEVNVTICPARSAANIS